MNAISDANVARPVRDDEIETFRRFGVVHLRGVLSPEWVAVARSGMEKAMSAAIGDPSLAGDYNDMTELAAWLESSGVPLVGGRKPVTKDMGHFKYLVGAWTMNREMQVLVQRSPMPEIAASLLGSTRIHFYDDQLLWKEPRCQEHTAFHADEPYFHLSGDMCCVMWLPIDPAPVESGAMRYVRGSHRWGRDFKSHYFVSRKGIEAFVNTSGETRLDQSGREDVPDVEAQPGEYDVVCHPAEPGDLIVHHFRTLHGSRGNETDRPRRAGSFRYCGDDIRYRRKPSAPPNTHHRHDLRDGDTLDCEQFPVVWPGPTAAADRPSETGSIG